MAAYLRGQFPFIGIPAPGRVALVRAALDGLGKPTERDLADLGRACWRRREREYQYAACFTLRRHAAVPGPGFIEVAQQLITTKSWWDTVDELTGHLVGPLVRHHPELGAAMDAWIDSENIWLARTAILHQTRYKHDTDAKKLFAYCRKRASDGEFFIRKAIGWALREYAKIDPAAVKGFVRRNDAVLSGLSKREALKHPR